RGKACAVRASLFAGKASDRAHATSGNRSEASGAIAGAKRTFEKGISRAVAVSPTDISAGCVHIAKKIKPARTFHPPASKISLGVFSLVPVPVMMVSMVARIVDAVTMVQIK